MSIINMRFRNEGGLVVLQVLTPKTVSAYYSDKDPDWRDAVTGDLLDVAEYMQCKYQTVVKSEDTEGLHFIPRDY